LPQPSDGTKISNVGVKSIVKVLASTGIPYQTTVSFRGDSAATSEDDLAMAQYRTLHENGNRLTYSKYDNGHNFDTEKQSVWLSHPAVVVKPFVAGSPASYVGPLCPNSTSSGVHGYLSAPSVNSDFYGAEFISMTRPNKPVFDAANTLGELRTEGLPKIFGTIVSLQSRVAFFRSLGKEYLNAQFGWAPLERAFEDLLYVVQNSEKLVYQYLADNGKDIRRKAVLPVQATNLSIETNKLFSIAFSTLSSSESNLFDPSKGGQAGRAEVIQNSTRTLSFSGKYNYYLGDPSSEFFSNMSIYSALAKKLVGLRITPSSLWELKPWTWLLDWHANIGTILGNVEGLSSDNLILKYGYLMCEDELDKVVSVYRHGLPAFGPVTVRFRTLRKRRIKAYPYGFSLDPSSYSAYQWSIIGALLSTKTPTSLR